MIDYHDQVNLWCNIYLICINSIPEYRNGLRPYFCNISGETEIQFKFLSFNYLYLYNNIFVIKRDINRYCLFELH